MHILFSFLLVVVVSPADIIMVNYKNRSLVDLSVLKITVCNHGALPRDRFAYPFFKPMICSFLAYFLVPVPE